MRNAAVKPPVPTQLVLMAGAEAALPAIEAALSKGPVAALLVRLGPADDRAAVNQVKALARVAQAAGTALMIDGAPEAAVRGGADGVHLSFSPQAVRDAVGRLAPERMVGVAGLKSRDDAMTAGELGCDYVMFGEPDAAGRLPPFAAVTERVRWWAALFEVPVVGYAPDLAGVAALAGAGADFVALGAAAFDHAAGPAAAVAEALRVLDAVAVA